MDIYRIGSTIAEEYEGPGHQFVTDILINPGEEVYLYINGFGTTEGDLKKHVRDMHNICKYLNHQQRVQEELFDKNGC